MDGVPHIRAASAKQRRDVMVLPYSSVALFQVHLHGLCRAKEQKASKGPSLSCLSLARPLGWCAGDKESSSIIRMLEREVFVHTTVVICSNGLGFASQHMQVRARDGQYESSTPHTAIQQPTVSHREQ